MKAPLAKTQWKLDEFRSLCAKRKIPDSTIFQNSLEWRWRRADFHAAKATEVWADLFTKSFEFGDQWYFEHEFTCEAHAEACVSCLHAMADVLGQIVNVAILGGTFAEDEVSIKRILAVLNKHGIAPQVAKKIDQLLSHGSYAYLEAFNNTIKHRHLLGAQFRAEYGGTSRNDKGLVFQDFQYKGRSYPRTWLSDITQTMRVDMFSLVTEIGLEITEYVRRLK